MLCDNSWTHSQWLEFYVKIHGMTGKYCVVFCPKGWKRSLFLNLWLEFQLRLSGHSVLAFGKKGKINATTSNNSISGCVSPINIAKDT